MRLIVDPMRVAIAAEYDSAHALVRAAGMLRDRGYVRVDAYTPYPLPELEDRLGIRRTRLPRSVFVAGLLGACVGYGIQWYCNAWSYPIRVGGRPLDALPAFIPITFETTVLFAALATFVGFFVASRLPEPWNPLFELPGFDRATVDRFWLAIDGRDPRYDPEGTPVHLAQTAPLQLLRPQAPP